MRAHRMLVPALVLAISAPATAQNEVPSAFRHLKPHQIVEAVMAERQTLGLTDVQERGLDSLNTAIRKEPHRYEGPSPGVYQYRHRAMVSRSRAYAEALSTLTPEQQAKAEARFTDSSYRLPAELQAPGARADGQPVETGATAPEPAIDPLQHHGAKVPPGRAVKADSGKWIDPAKNPLQHPRGRPPAAGKPATGDTGKPVNPVTHRPYD